MICDRHLNCSLRLEMVIISGVIHIVWLAIGKIMLPVDYEVLNKMAVLVDQLLIFFFELGIFYSFD